MNALVRIRDGEARANSRDVAATFERQHKNVLQSIDRIMAEASEASAMFSAHDYKAGGAVSRDARYYEMDRDGFALLAMGFTGPKALRWKLAYIDAFNRMEAELSVQAANDDPGRSVPAEQLDDREAWRVGLQLVREARTLGGRAAGRRAWLVAQLPDVFSEDATFKALADGSAATVPETVREWATARLEQAPGQVVGTQALFDDYSRFCRARAEETVTRTAFGRSLPRLGLHKYKSGRTAVRGVALAS